MKKVTAIALAVVVCGAPALAGPMKADQVAGDARWVAHLDVTTLLKSGLAKFILAEAEKKDSFLDGIAQVREALGFDPLRDLRGVTIYGKTIGDEQAVVVLDATANQEKLLALIGANPSYRAHEYGDRELHEWTDEPKTVVDKMTGEEVVKPGKTNFGAFYDPNTVLVASTLDLLKGAVTVLDGEADSLAKTRGIKMLPEPLAGSFLIAAADRIKLPADHKDAKNPVLTSITDIGLQVGEQEDHMFLSAAALAPDAKRALRLRQILQGFIALGQMMLAERQDLPVLGETIRVNGEGNSVTVEASVPTGSMIEMIQHLAAKKARAAGGGSDAF